MISEENLILMGESTSAFSSVDRRLMMGSLSSQCRVSDLASLLFSKTLERILTDLLYSFSLLGNPLGGK